MTPLLELTDLTLTVPAKGGSRLILDEVSLQVDPGEALGLIGESGSGKSTTARAIMRAVPGAHVTGSIRFDGADLMRYSKQELRRYRSSRVAMIGQSPRATMNPVRRVGDFAAEALRVNLRIPRTQARAKLASGLQEVGITTPERVLDLYPHQLSGGMLQRVVIASAIAADPVLLIADEPTSALDVTTQGEVAAILMDLMRRRDLAMLFITHDLDLAVTVCDRAAVMYAGRIVEEQHSARILTSPRHPYSHGLTQARTRADIDVERLQAIPGRPIAAFEATSGCAFAPRCRFAQPECSTTRPPLESAGGTRIACLRHHEIADSLTVEKV